MTNRLAWIVGLCLTAGCHSPSATPPLPPASSTGNDKTQSVTIALNWFPEAEHGGFYAALVHGYFQEAGLEVTIQPGGPNAPVLQLAAAGRVHFAVDNADKLLLARAQEADVIAVMAPIQDSPRCLLVHGDSGISTFDDLARQPRFTVFMSAGQPFARFLAKRLDLSRVNVAPYSGNVAPFLLDKHSALQGYSFSEPFVARRQGADPKLLMVSELGFNTYTSLLVCGRKLIDERPELVRKVVAASIRGWQHYLDQPEATNEYIHSLNSEMELDILEFGARELRSLCLPDKSDPSQLGRMTDERWETLTRQLRETEALSDNRVQAADAFTTEFLTETAEISK